jgi:hypothetical protein
MDHYTEGYGNCAPTYPMPLGRGGFFQYGSVRLDFLVSFLIKQKASQEYNYFKNKSDIAPLELKTKLQTPLLLRYRSSGA